MATGRNVLMATIGNVVPPVLALATQPLLAYGLGVDGRGELAAATAPLLLATTVLTLGLPDALTHYVARTSARLGSLAVRAVLVLCAVGLIGLGITAAAAPALANGDSALAGLILIGTVGLAPALVVAAMRGIAAGRGLWTRVTAERVAGAVIRLVSVAVLFGVGQLTPLTATIAVAGATFLGGVVYLWPWPSVASTGERPTLGMLARFGVRVWIGAVAGFLLMRLDQLLMTPLAGAAQLGLYAVAVTLSEVVLVVNAGIRDVVYAAESGDARPDRVGFASRLSTLATLVAAIVLAALSPWLVPLLFGAGFAPAVPVVLVLLAAIAVGNPGSVAGAALGGWGRPGLRSASLGIAAAVNLVAVLLLVPPLGALGAAIATGIGNLVSSNLNILWLKLRFGVPVAESYLPHQGDARRFGRTLAALAAESRLTYYPAAAVALLPVLFRSWFSRARVVGDADAVVSLTTHGARLRTVHLAIESIARGTRRPRRVVLWLNSPQADAPLPRSLRRLVRRGLEVATAENLGPHTKWFPALGVLAEQEPLVLVDDDVLYPADLLATLLTTAARHPGAVACFRARVVQVNDGRAQPYSTWPLCRDTEPSVAHFWTAVSGVLLPPAFVQVAAAGGEGFRSASPWTDDVWLHHLAVASGTPAVQAEATPRDWVRIPTTGAGSLFHSNVLGGDNDVQIAATYSASDLRAIAAATRQAESA